MDKIIIKKWALQNALAYGGKANPGAVIGKVIAEHPEAKERIAEIAKEIQQIVREINKLSAEQQKKELESLAPELLEKKEKEEHELKPLPDAEMGKVILRLAPEPSKYLHIGHALVFMIQYLYAKRYKGRCYLRIEDTNPEKSKKEFYDSIIEDLRWLGIKYAKEIIVSDEMPLFYDSAEKLISAKDAYVCKCAQEEMKKLREEKQPCHCRNNPDSLGTSMKEWKAMLSGKFRPGERTLRLAGDMENQNGTLRDPVIFRISDTPHYRQKKKFRVWPMYDFENAVADAHWKTTHVIRSKEFELRAELQDLIRSKLGLEGPRTIDIGRFNIAGAETQGRVIRELIEKGDIKDWDDPRLVTIKALRRRGFVPKMFEDLAVIAGLSKTGGMIDFAVLSSINRKIIDPAAHRYFFIADPVLITVDNAPEENVVELDLHPGSKKGGRKLKAGNKIFVDKHDLDQWKEHEEVRLMGCMNIMRQKDKFFFTSKENAKFRGHKRIHWLPNDENGTGKYPENKLENKSENKSENKPENKSAKLSGRNPAKDGKPQAGKDEGILAENDGKSQSGKDGKPQTVKARVMMPDATWKEGLAEINAVNLKEGDIIQFERFGFCRLDDRKKMEFRFAHG